MPSLSACVEKEGLSCQRELPFKQPRQADLLFIRMYSIMKSQENQRLHAPREAACERCSELCTACTGDSVWYQRVCSACDGGLRLARLCQRRRAVVPRPHQGGCCHSLGPGVTLSFSSLAQTSMVPSLQMQKSFQRRAWGLKANHMMVSCTRCASGRRQNFGNAVLIARTSFMDCIQLGLQGQFHQAVEKNALPSCFQASA